MDEINLTLLPANELPETEEKKVKPKVNCLSEVLREIMYERKIEAVEIHKNTGISFSTLSGWLLGTVNCQMADRNLMKLGKYLNVSLWFLLFGVGDDSPYFEDFEDFEENENENEEGKEHGL